MSQTPTPLGPGSYQIPAGSTVTDAAEDVWALELDQPAVVLVPQPAPPPDPPIVLTTLSLPDAQVGTAYSQVLQASGGTGTLSWSVGGLPTGLTAEENVISGTPTGPGLSSVSVVVTDTLGETVSATIALTVDPAPAPPPVSTAPALAFFVTGQSPSGEASAAAALGVTVTAITQYGDNSSPYSYSPPAYEAGKTLIVGLGPASSSELTTIASAIKAAGWTAPIIRWCWEMNGNWFDWGIQGGKLGWSAATFVTNWKAAYALVHSIIPGAVMCWNISMSATIPTSAYPGDSYVDAIGIDGYNYTGYAAQYATLLAFRAEHDKPLVIGEWGCETGSGHDTDYAAYAAYVISVIQNPANACLAQVYFDSPAITGFAAMEAAYKDAFAG